MTDPSMDLEQITANRLLLVGVGGGGCNAVSRMREGWAEGPPCLVMDSDGKALLSTAMEHRLLIGESLTQGMGAGGQPDVGRMAAEDSEQDLADVVSGYDVVVVNAGLGGGTGTGAAPVLGRIAQGAGALVISFVTLPFRFEGEETQRQARAGLRDIRMSSDVVIVQPNDLLLQTAGDEAIPEAFLVADTMLGVGVRALWRLLTRPGLLHLGLADIRETVANSGKTCAYGFGMGQGENRVEAAVNDLLENSLLDHGLQLAKSASILVQIVAGPDITLREVEAAMAGIRARARDGAHIAFGVALESEWSSRMALTLLCSEQAPAEEDATPKDPPAGTRADPDRETASAGAGSKPAAPHSGSRPGRRAGDRRRRNQKKLAMGGGGKGRFQNVEPTFHDGEDLDVPTFRRKGIRLSGEAG